MVDSDWLLPLVCVLNNVGGSRNPAKGSRIVIEARKPSSVTSGGFYSHNAGQNPSDDFIPTQRLLSIAVTEILLSVAAFPIVYRAHFDASSLQSLSKGETSAPHLAYNFIKIHRTLRTSPAMAAGVTDRLWDVADLVALWESYEQRRAA